MRISDIKKQWNGSLVVGNPEAARHIGVFQVVNDSRHVTMGCAFCAIRPTALKRDKKTDEFILKMDERAKYMHLAIKSGAQLIIADKDFDIDVLELDSYTADKIFVLLVDSAASTFAQLDAVLTPIAELQMTAVTGTNGKSSTVAMVRDMLQHCEINAFSVGTLGVIGTEPLTRLYDNLTTPSANASHQIFRILKSHFDAEAIVLEASSQGLAEGRLSGVPIDVAAFTNFSLDHQDYHALDQTSFKVDQDGAMDRYFEAKLSLFIERTRLQATIVLNQNMDRYLEAHSRILASRSDLKILTYGRNPDADIKYSTGFANESAQSLTFNYHHTMQEVELPLAGAFQAENAACAVAIGLAWGIPFAKCVAGLQHVRRIPGRMELVGTTLLGGSVFVDYAHTPDAIRNAISSARELGSSKPLSIVFGCGGERDPIKRPEMAREAAKADLVYITDDNPRADSPEVIRSEILKKCHDIGASHAIAVPDRYNAIRLAISELPAGGLLLICGKGHEEYQEVAARDTKEGKRRKHRISFSDAEVAKLILDEPTTLVVGID